MTADKSSKFGAISPLTSTQKVFEIEITVKSHRNQFAAAFQKNLYFFMEANIGVLTLS